MVESGTATILLTDLVGSTALQLGAVRRAPTAARSRAALAG